MSPLAKARRGEKYLMVIPPPNSMPPLLFGPDEVTQGYYELEALERGNTRETLRRHPETVALWYRALTLYMQGVRGTLDLSDKVQTHTDLMALNLQGQLLGLGISSSKAALDMLLAGYYSVAYAAIRHMLESFVQYLYVATEPDEAKRWYDQPAAVKGQMKTPGCRQMVDRIKQDSDLISPDFIEQVYDAWGAMCKGAHPTGEGLYQLVGVEEGSSFTIGPTYDRNLYLIGFRQGLFAITNLLHALQALKEQPAEWLVADGTLRREILSWQEGFPDEYNDAHLAHAKHA
jgi:hypothetical protein